MVKTKCMDQNGKVQNVGTKSAFTCTKNIGVNAFLVPIFWFFFFHFSPYIFILPLLVSKSINTCYFRHFHQSTDRNILGD